MAVAELFAVMQEILDQLGLSHVVAFSHVRKYAVREHRSTVLSAVFTCVALTTCVADTVLAATCETQLDHRVYAVEYGSVVPRLRYVGFGLFSLMHYALASEEESDLHGDTDFHASVILFSTVQDSGAHSDVRNEVDQGVLAVY